MKKLSFVFLLFSFVTVSAQEIVEEVKEVVEVSGPVVAFEETKWDFGDMHQGDKVEHTFKFENSGNEPLIISNVLVQCGCTATKWPREPIAPGTSEEIVVSFNSAGKMGLQNKTITVVSNATNDRAIVRFTTNVLPKKESN